MFSLLIAFAYFTISSLLLLLPRVLRIWGSVFNSQALFTLHPFPTFDTTWFYQGFPEATVQPSRLKGRGSKNKPGPSVCLNHTVFGKRYYLVGSIYVLGAATNYYINYLSGFKLSVNTYIFFRRIYYPLSHWTF